MRYRLATVLTIVTIVSGCSAAAPYGASVNCAVHAWEIGAPYKPALDACTCMVKAMYQTIEDTAEGRHTDAARTTGQCQPVIDEMRDKAAKTKYPGTVG